VEALSVKISGRNLLEQIIPVFPIHRTMYDKAEVHHVAHHHHDTVTFFRIYSGIECIHSFRDKKEMVHNGRKQ